jgi:hypothetical protein
VDNPYLIADGAELAYLGAQVNTGTMYEGAYFQLTNSIDLDERSWTPIGNYNSYSFRGIFDGAGHQISNTAIRTKAANTTGIESYGIFGSIGWNSTANLPAAYAEVKNLELKNIVIELSGGGFNGAQEANFSSGSGFQVGLMCRNYVQ